MARRNQFLLTCVFGATIVATAGFTQDRPKVIKSAPSPDERKQRQAQKVFARAVAEYRQDLILDAIRSLEECLKLDPAAVPPRKLLAAALAVVGRTDDAISELQKVTASSADDFDAWERYADQLHEKGETKMAREALRKAVAAKSIEQNPKSWLMILNRLATWSEKAGDHATAEFALRQLVRLLDEEQAAIREAGVLTLAEIPQEKADALERLGEACLRNRRLDDAAAAFAESARIIAARKDPQAAARVGRLNWQQAQLFEARREPAKALTHLKLALEQRPRSAAPYRLLVRLLTQLDRQREALAEVEKYARLDRANTELQLVLAEQYAAAGRTHDVQQVFARLLESGPRSQLYQALFTHLEQANRSDLVLTTLDDRLAVANDKNKPEAERDEANTHARAMYSVLRQKPALIRALLPQAWDQKWREFRDNRNLDYRTYEVLGNLAARAGELPAAENLLRDSLRGMRFRRGGWDGSTAEALIQVLMAQRKYREVIDFCKERVQNSDVNAFMYHYYQSLPLARLGDYDKALAVNATAIELGSDRNKFITRLQRVEIMQWAGRFGDAIKECEAIRKEYPQKKETRDLIRTLAGVYSAKGDHARAEQELRKLLENDPSDAGVCNDLGYQLAEQNRNLDEAELLVRRALQLDRAERRGSGDEDHAAYLDSLAWVLFRKGNAAEARQILEKAAADADARDDSTIWDHLGDVCYRLGDTASARKAWQRALENSKAERRVRTDGRSEEIQRKLQSLPDN